MTMQRPSSETDSAPKLVKKFFAHHDNELRIYYFVTILLFHAL